MRTHKYRGRTATLVTGSCVAAIAAALAVGQSIGSAGAQPQTRSATPPSSAAKFRVFRTATSPASPPTYVVQVAAKLGQVPAGIRQLLTASDGTTLWTTANATEVCLLAEQPDGVVESACQSVAAANAGKLWMQRDAEVFGLVPDGAVVTSTPLASTTASSVQVTAGGYAVTLTQPSAISVRLGTGAVTTNRITELP